MRRRASRRRGAAARRSGNRVPKPIPTGMTVVFRVAAGPRRGFGHLVRCRSLARALGVPAAVSIRGAAATRRLAAALGWTVLPGGPQCLRAMRPAVLVIDDPWAGAAAPWVRGARRLGITVASVHDQGVAPVAAQLSVDGSAGRTAACGTHVRLRGPRFAVLDPGVAEARHRRRPATAAMGVLVALGGGRQARQSIVPLVRHLAAARPDLDIRVAAGFTTPRRPLPAGRFVTAPDGLARELSTALVAVVAGGVTAYEACALGVPAVAAAVVPAQAPTIAALARAGAVVAAGRLRSGADARRIAAAALRLLDDGPRRAALRRRGRALVDGRGAARVADAVRRLADAA